MKTAAPSTHVPLFVKKRGKDEYAVNPRLASDIANPVGWTRTVPKKQKASKKAATKSRQAAETKSDKKFVISQLIRLSSAEGGAETEVRLDAFNLLACLLGIPEGHVVKRRTIEGDVTFRTVA